MLASDVATRVRELINDPDGVRWSDDELLRWISDAQLFIVNYRPDATAATSVLALAAGTKQALPATDIRLLDVVRAIKQDDTPSTSLSYVDRDLLDSQDPDWHNARDTFIVRNVVYDNRVPREFWVSPPAKAGAKIEITTSVLPVDATALSDVLTVADNYREQVVSYVCARCYMKDTEARTDRAALHLQALSQSLGIKLQKDVAFQPDLNNKGGNPNTGSLSLGGV